jgi:hypothetical protein
MSLWIKRAVALVAGCVTWWLCFRVTGLAMAQTGMDIPADVLFCRDIFRVLWFPFSWIPLPHTIGTGEMLVILLIGVPYGVVVGLGVRWLLRSRPDSLRGV